MRQVDYDTGLEFSKTKLKSVIKSVTDKWVSEDSAVLLGQELQIYGRGISREAYLVAQENGRKTVRAEDVREAKKRLDVE